MSFADLKNVPGTRDLFTERELDIKSKTKSGASIDMDFKSNSFYDEMLFLSGKSKTVFDLYCKELRRSSKLKATNAKKDKLISEL